MKHFRHSWFFDKVPSRNVINPRVKKKISKQSTGGERIIRLASSFMNFYAGVERTVASPRDCFLLQNSSDESVRRARKKRGEDIRRKINTGWICLET